MNNMTEQLLNAGVEKPNRRERRRAAALNRKPPMALNQHGQMVPVNATVAKEKFVNGRLARRDEKVGQCSYTVFNLNDTTRGELAGQYESKPYDLVFLPDGKVHVWSRRDALIEHGYRSSLKDGFQRHLDVLAVYCGLENYAISFEDYGELLRAVSRGQLARVRKISLLTLQPFN